MLKGFEIMRILKVKVGAANKKDYIKNGVYTTQRFGLEFICDLTEEEKSLANNITHSLKEEDNELYTKIKNKFEDAFEKALKDYILKK